MTLTTDWKIEIVRARKFPAPGRILSTIGRVLRFPLVALRRRRRYARLLELDDRLLDDVGLRRAEVERASQLPFWRDAESELSYGSTHRGRPRRR
ncbi:DUF1127 domain-containing protein [Tropicimonas sp. IMCC6043]|uniref:DUF1127 domain-containing protein n=1 Tax=Tropicimonas sp. IMCC6043 TaxID=2510645 RepID=UPI00101BF06A|nr:DUF1127 domain-containing protein [Tropicimonas sp. IMCC6043]RYH08423.1 DUF1127 domain-containing protein [Tropicimonas sp. IMCC6043]